MGYPNQKNITVIKCPCDTENKYAKINLSALHSAMQNLTKIGAIKLWLYFAKNQNGYTFDLSCVDCNDWGIKSDSYHSAVKELIEKRYLVNTATNHYTFHELPQNLPSTATA